MTIQVQLTGEADASCHVVPILAEAVADKLDRDISRETGMLHLDWVRRESSAMIRRTSGLTATVAAVLLLFSSAAAAVCDLAEPKKRMFGGLELIRACSIVDAGALSPEFGIPANICAAIPAVAPQEPLLSLVAQDMLYFNWEIPPANVAALEAELGLAESGFRIAPIEIIKGEKPRHYLSLNFYKAPIAGIVNYRSEWSIYVTKEGDPKPRYMVIEVYSSEDTVDPTMPPGFINPASRVDYDTLDNEITVSNRDFTASFSRPPGLPGTSHATAKAGWGTVRKSLMPGQALAEANDAFSSSWRGRHSKGNAQAGVGGYGRTVLVGQPWAQANDALYWINGIADTALYNGILTATPVHSIDPRGVRLSNHAPWSAYVAQTPTSVLLFEQDLEFAFTPYFNLRDNSLDLEPGYKAALQTVKELTFGAASYGHAFQVLFGLAEPQLRFDVLGGNVPSIFINFNIPQQMVRALEAELDLPPGFRLVPSRMTDSQPGKYMLTLNIYEMPDVLTGMPVFRAEWSVYVQDQNDPTASGGYLMVIDLNSNSPSLDPYNGSTPASDFVYQEIDGHLSAAIAGLDATPKFSIGFELPPPGSPPIVLSEAWILSNDRIYWRNGVYDRLLYNGLLLDADVVEVDPASAIIDDRTPWARFVDATPLQVAVFRNPLQFAVNPWYNVEERCQSGFRSTGKTHRDSYASDPSARSTSNPQL